jgi:extradiol dioxygenase family protein
MAQESKGGSLDTMHHVAVVVPDIRQAIAWYTTTFNCTIHHQDDTWAFLDFANIQLALVTPSQHPAHLAFVSPQAERFGPLQRHRDGTRSIYISDPFGNAVEMIAAEEKEKES